MKTTIALARVWRPTQLSEVIGQETIVQTLAQSWKQQRFHHAYLFTGSRGVGKTSLARIFAKLLRCPFVKMEGNLPYSCEACRDCKEITHGMSLDVLELDGASYNGVESVREIRDQLVFLPNSGQKKIYILDEVHMLTTAAFNALLKTIEEPPAHVLFIFATTDPQKIPSTVLSRCLRLDYKRIAPQHIEQRLQWIVQKEGLPQPQSGVLSLIAESCEGSMRDALSILDQAIAACPPGSSLKLEKLQNLLGMLPFSTLLSLTESILSQNPEKALHQIQMAFDQGMDLKALTKHLLDLFHLLLLIQVCGEGSDYLKRHIDMRYPQEALELKRLARLHPLNHLEMLFQVFYQGSETMMRSSIPKTYLDLLCIKAASGFELGVFASPHSFQKPNLSSLPASSVSSSHDNNTIEPAKNLKAIQAQPVPAARSLPTFTPLASTLVATGSQLTGSQEGKSWIKFIEHVRNSLPALAAYLEKGQLDTQDEHNIHLSFPSEQAFCVTQIKDYQDRLKILIKGYYGAAKQVHCGIKEQKKKTEKPQQSFISHAIIVEAKNLFGGELGPVEIYEG